MPASFSYNLTKNLTAQYAHNLYAVLPKIKEKTALKSYSHRKFEKIITH